MNGYRGSIERGAVVNGTVESDAVDTALAYAGKPVESTPGGGAHVIPNSSSMPISRGPSRHAAPRLAVLVGLAGVLAFGAKPAQARMEIEAPETFGRGPASTYALREPNIFSHNVGLLTLQVTNLGIFGNPFIDELSAGWRGGEYLYASGLWVGAIGEDAEPHVSTALYALEFRPSLLPVDTIYESFEGQRNGQRPGFASGDDDGDGLLDEDFQNGKDDDGDGRIDEDFAAVGQQMFSCEYRDDTPEALSQVNEHRALGLKVQQRSFQWATDGINEFVGFDFNMINVGDQRLKEIYIGFFADVDAGPKQQDRYWTDDLVGYTRVDTTVFNESISGACAREKISVDLVYIWDAPDNGTTIVGGDVPGYMGLMFLGHTTDATGVKAPQRVGLSTVKWTAATGAYPQGDPRTDFERYDLLSKGEIPRRNANKPDDYRYTVAAGPFSEMNPGDNITFQVAFAIGEGQQGLVNNAIAAQRIYNGQYVDGDQNPLTGIEGKERCLRIVEPGSEILWNDPCDTLNIVNLRWRQTTCFYVDDDCNTCSGVDGKEGLLNWVGTTAPPPPLLNTDPKIPGDQVINPGFEIYAQPPGRDRKVVLQWDNTSELRRDPITGKDLFEGYRIWRVDGWQRPEGSVGPTPQEWMLLAEFRKNPRDGLGLSSPFSLRQVEQRTRTEIKEMTPYGPLYKIGRYEWADESGVINGRVYFYAVTAFGIDTRQNPVTGEMEEVILSGQPAAVQKEAVISSWGYGTGCSDIGVVPNPYRGGADWDLQPSDCDPTGTKLAFRNLPEGWSQLSIYTLAGDLVLSVGPDDSRVIGGCEISEYNRLNGTFYWDLISRNGQNVVAGIYLYAVEIGGQICRGRFVIIR